MGWHYSDDDANPDSNHSGSSLVAPQAREFHLCPESLAASFGSGAIRILWSDNVKSSTRRSRLSPALKRR